MKVFDASGQQLVALGIDTGTSNALSVLSQAVSVLSQGLSVVSNAASNALSVANAASNAASVVSQAMSVLSQAVSVAQAALSVRIDTQSQSISVLSQQVSALSQDVSARLVSVNNAISVVSNAVSVVSQAVSVASAQAASALSQALSVISVTDAALSAAINVVSNTLSNLTSIHNVLSNRVSANSAVAGSGSVTSNEASAISAQAASAINVVSNAVSVLSVIAESGVGQCRLSVKSTTSVTLQPYQGQLVWINGKAEKVPSGGVDLGTGGLTSATTYNLYAFMSAVSVMTLEATVSAHATDTAAGNIGVEIKSGDATRTLVGMVRLNAAVNFVNSATQRFLLNWFNRRGLHGANTFTATRTTTSAGYVEINTEIRVEFLTWATEAVGASCIGFGFQSTQGEFFATALAFDGTAQDAGGLATGPQANYYVMLNGGGVYSLAEGYHYATWFGAVSAGTGSYYGGAQQDQRCTVAISIRG